MHFCPQIREEPDEAQHCSEEPEFLHLEQEWQQEEEDEDSPGVLMLASKVKELRASVTEYRVSRARPACSLAWPSVLFTP